MQSLLLVALSFAAAMAAPDSPPPPYGAPPAYPAHPAQYEYAYAVKDDYAAVDFDAQEKRDGDATEGGYRVVLPDGRTQIVTYSVNGYDGGFVADVTYEGEAQYPAEAPAYPPPPPPYGY